MKRDLTTREKLDNLLKALNDVDEDDALDEIESMTDEEVEAYLIAEGFDLDKVNERFDKLLADLKDRTKSTNVADPKDAVR